MPHVRPSLLLWIGASVVFLLLLESALVPETARWLILVGAWVVILLQWVRLTSPAQRLLRRRRARLAGPVIEALYGRWEAAGILARHPASADDIARFERENGVVLPAAMRAYFTTINGTSQGEVGQDDEYSVGFWHLDQVRTFAGTHIRFHEAADRTFAFADCFTRMTAYGVRLSSDAAATTPIVARFPYGEFQMASTFEEFLTRYVLGDTSVLSPEFTAVADDHGIGSEAGGPVSYVMRWSDVERIEVVTALDATETAAMAYWVVTGAPNSPPFIAPVDTVAGGHLLRARICSLDGFDDSAFQAAREAEARGENGTFVVWRRTMSGL
jgi:hypothetical protein